MRLKLAKRRQKDRRRRKASALVIVLSSLSFMAALALAFLASVGTELRSSKRYADGVSVQLLAQSAFNLAQTQITEATKGVSGSGGALAWASQPGMIRTYTESGAKANYYRLYSWDVLTGSGNFNAATEKSALDNWDSKKALFTDLNEPIRTGSETLYPIIDGNNLKSGVKDSTGTVSVPGKTYDLDNDDKWDIEGFNVGALPAAVGSANPLPMPVKWLYVLQDGTIVPGSATGNPDEARIAGATAGNPIVGRIAFWADDETSKININTASEGSFWDMPRVYCNRPTGSTDLYDNNLAKLQPVRGEFQRYPAHPATTSLSTVLKKPATPVYTDAQWAEQIYGIIPRVKTGGSYAGTVQTTQMNPPEIIPDADRLYASVDELIFKPATAGGNRELNDPVPANPKVLNKATLERAKFFLTASSRSPDVNLFNKPRVCLWPLHVTDSAAKRTVYDKLIAFCSTMRSDLGAKAYRYYFQREDSNSPTHDLPAGGSVSGLGRNRMLLEYLRSLAGQNIPGFGGNFRAKYGADTDQILTEIFDYIRSTNLRDSLIPVSTDKYTVPTNTWSAGSGQVVPIEDSATGTRGFGRIRTLQGGALLFIGRADSTCPPGPSVPATSPADTLVAAGHMRVQAMFIPQFFDPSVGVVFDCPNFKWQIEGLDSFKWDIGAGPVSMGFPASVTKTENYYAFDNAYYGDQYGLRQTARQGPTSNTLDMPSGPGTTFSFIGTDITVKLLNSNDTVIQTIKLKFPDGVFPVPDLPPDVVYNYDWNGSPNQYFPGPWSMRSFSGRNSATGNGVAWILKEDTIRSVSASPGDIRLIAARKIVPQPGSVGYPYAPSAKYGDSTVHVMGQHNFFDGAGCPHYGAALGRLVQDAAYDLYSATGNTSNQLSYPPSTSPGGLLSSSSASDIPLNGVAVGKSTSFAAGDIPGDWDNGPLNVRDGPYINKADEGDIGDSAGDIPYSWKGKDGGDLVTASMFTANRVVPSAVTLGSLPTGVLSNRPWQTLLFRPDPLGDGSHPGSRNRRGDGSPATGMPADHLLLDLFHMPVVEPYAISEPLATSGRINMNYQIVPFSYINRDTGIRAVLKNEKVTSIRDSEAGRYKVSYDTSPRQTYIRFPVNIEETLTGFNTRFNTDNDLFRSASEICEIHIVPIDPGSTTDTYNSMPAYWNAATGGHRLTGDNSKERIYATVYPRLTTKSNTFTVYARVQTLKQIKSHTPEIWTEGKDLVTGQYRGYQTIERYVDPNNPALPDYASSGTGTPLGTFYKTRVLSAKQFAP